MSDLDKRQSSANAVKTVGVMIAATVLSKLLGMLRGVLLASHYGLSMEANAFSAASRILGCFIPVYNGFIGNNKTGGEEEADTFALTFLNVILVLTGFLAIVGVVFAKPIISLIAPGLNKETAKLAASLLRIMFPMVMFTGAAYTLVGLMQSKNKFILPALISSISNFGVIVYFVFVDNSLGDKSIYGLAVAYVVSWILQFVTLAVPLAKTGFKYKPYIDFKNKGLIKAIKMCGPIMVGSWLTPIGVMAGTFFATYVNVDGAVTVFDYANNAYVIIIGTLTYSICNFVFPKLSRLSSDEDSAAFAETVRVGLTSTLFIVAPFMAAVMILTGEGIAVLYMRNEFTPEAARLTAGTLKSIAIAMPAFSLVEILSRVFYSKKLTFYPMIAAVTGIVVNILSAKILVGYDVLGVGSVGYANALGQIAMATVLVISVFGKIKKVFSKELILNVVKIIICALISFVGMNLVRSLTGNDPYSSTMLKNILVCVIVFAVGAAVYLIMAKILRVSVAGKNNK